MNPCGEVKVRLGLDNWLPVAKGTLWLRVFMNSPRWSPRRSNLTTWDLIVHPICQQMDERATLWPR